MNVGIIGGTGGMGKGFAIRWCKNHNVVIGSRDAERANRTFMGSYRSSTRALLRSHK